MVYSDGIISLHMAEILGKPVLTTPIIHRTLDPSQAAHACIWPFGQPSPPS